MQTKQRKCDLKVLLLALIFALWAFVSVGYVSAAEWHVYPGQSIQTAINSAGIGDTIYVHAGIYVENVDVNRRLTLIGIDNPVIDAGALGSAIYLNADGITLDGFTTTNPRPTLGDGGIMVNSNNNTLKNNSAFYNNFCIYLNQSNNNTIAGNDASNSDAWGIVLHYAHNNRITDNQVNNNFFPAINVFYSNNNTIKGNDIANTNFQGIYLFDSSNNTITENNLSDNAYGAYLSDFSVNNKIYFNNFVYNRLGQAADEPDANSWDNGYPAGGNYWSDYTGMDEFSGVNQDEPGSDGFGDTPYEIPPAGAEDNYPLMQPWGGPIEPRPVLNLNSGKRFTSIQAAIDDSSTRQGHIITVDPGTYTENVIVNKRLTLKSTSGDPTDTIITAAYPNAHVVEITASYVNVNGFSLKGATGSFKAGIHLDHVNNCNISENIVSNNGFGIYLIFSDNNIVMNNNANLNDYGIYTPYSSTNTISGNDASNNHDGIVLQDSSGNMLTDNTVHWNTLAGISLGHANSNTLINNNAAYNYQGIKLFSSNNNTLAYNMLSHNIGQYKKYGLELYSSSNNAIYLNNFIDNLDNVYSENSTNIWSSTDPISYTYAGFNYTNYLGNYWDDYLNIDGNGDGIWDNPYSIDSNNKDHYPLKNPWETYFGKTQPPTAAVDVIAPNPAKQGKDIVSFIGHGNDSDGSVVAYKWTSSIDGLLNTSSSFTKPASELSGGVHTIYFSVQDYYGVWSSAATETLTILANQPPVASFIYSPGNPGTNETVTFNASASYDSDGTIVSYFWSFGDGNVTNTTELSVIHSYASVRFYIVILTVTDDGGATNTTLQVLQVSLKPPIAKFSCSPPNPAINETVTFNASGSYDPNGVITSCEFEFGDGSNGTGEVVMHTYSTVGTYTVNLTVTDNEGATNRTAQVIRVFPDVPYFDTEPGTYPSICGTHNGTIIPTHNLSVSKICVYSCAGTGGHIEYAKIWNASWGGAEAREIGYGGDWHNCSFDINFTLVAGAIYNYTITTGSYPQIHHTSELLTAKGWITCSEFTDANGKRYCTWIPAIRLE